MLSSRSTNLQAHPCGKSVAIGCISRYPNSLSIQSEEPLYTYAENAKPDPVVYTKNPLP